MSAVRKQYYTNTKKLYTFRTAGAKEIRVFRVFSDSDKTPVYPPNPLFSYPANPGSDSGKLLTIPTVRRLTVIKS